MIKAVIIDDEKRCVATLEHDLGRFCPEVEILAACNSAKDGILAINTLKPNLVFLDIEMPLMDGFEMLGELEGTRNFELIFTTAYDQFILKALRLSAIDYLLKPIDPAELTLAVGRARNEIEKSTPNTQRINNLMANISLKEDEQKLALPGRNSYDFISPSEILYCRADGAYTEVLLANGKKLTLSKTLGETETFLPASVFLRIHHSTIINIKHVKQLKKGDNYFVTMANGDQLNIARSKKTELLSRMGVK